MPSWLSPVERLAVNQSVKGPNPFDGAIPVTHLYHRLPEQVSQAATPNTEKLLVFRLLVRGIISYQLLELLCLKRQLTILVLLLCLGYVPLGNQAAVGLYCLFRSSCYARQCLTLSRTLWRLLFG